MRAIDADRLLEERRIQKYYHLPNGDIAIPIIDIEHAPTVVLDKEWIPCSERLPDRNKYVLVTDNGETDIGRRFDGRWVDCYGDKLKDVTAWMPLPEPYKEEEE